jgi:hypothetical protein
MSTVNALVCTATCVPSAVLLLLGPPRFWFRLEGYSDFCYTSDDDYDELGNVLAVVLAAVGQSFTIRMVVDLVLQFCHGVLTVQETIHHVIFLSAGCIIRSNCIMPLNAAVLMSQEASTPFLNYYLFFRFRYPFSEDVNMAKFLFGVFFLIFRLVLNTLGVCIFLRQWLSPSPAMPKSMPVWEQNYMVFLMLAGAALQMYFAFRIVAALRTYGLRSPEMPGQAEEPLIKADASSNGCGCRG